MPYDSLVEMQSLVTKTTAFNSTAVDLKTRSPHRGLRCRLRVTNYSAAGAGAVWTPTIEESADNTTFNTLVTGTPMTCGTAAATSLQHLAFITTKRYVRLAFALSPTTSTPTISYQADLGIADP